MTRGRGPGLSEWVDECGSLLAAFFDTPTHWQAAKGRAEHELCDMAAQIAQRNEAGRLILLAASKMALRRCSRGASDLIILAQDADRQVAAIEWWGVAAAEAAQPVMFNHWGDRLPAGLPQLWAGKKQRLVEQAMSTRRPGETWEDLLARAGVSRAHGYRILDRKPKK